jgi:hypothetical protein
MATTARSKGTLVDVQAAAHRLQKQGEALLGRITKDAKTLATTRRSELVRDLQKLQRDVRTRVDRTVAQIERTLVKRLHAATEERVGKLERRVGDLERRFAELAGEPRDVG